MFHFLVHGVCFKILEILVMMCENDYRNHNNRLLVNKFYFLSAFINYHFSLIEKNHLKMQ